MEMTDEELDEATHKLAAGRVTAIQTYPYLAQGLYAMVPYPRPGLGTFTVDKRWRLYYDPQKCLEWTVSEIAAMWLHNASHLIRNHSQRFQSYGESQHQKIWNDAADASINTDLKDDKINLPDKDQQYYSTPNPTYPTWEKGMTTEELYISGVSYYSDGGEEADKGVGEDTDQEDAGETQSDGDSQSTEANDEGSKEGRDNPESYKVDNPEENIDDTPEGDATSQEDNDATPNETTSNAKELTGSPTSLSQEPGDTEPQRQEETSASGRIEGATEELGHDCGSGATGGEPRDYEEPADNTEDGSIEPDEAELLRQKVAEDIQMAKEAGKRVGNWEREAELILTPQVDWRRELLSFVRKQCASVLGQKDYTYSRPSRRSYNPKMFAPSLRAPKPPEISIVLDTSGSMNEQDLGVALREIDTILKRSRNNKGIKIFNCDAGVANQTFLQSINDLTIVGGGGTDMRVGLKAASSSKPIPDLVICITDGGTPWSKVPDNPKVNYVALIVGKAQHESMKRFYPVPEWIKVIYVERNPTNMGSLSLNG